MTWWNPYSWYKPSGKEGIEAERLPAGHSLLSWLRSIGLPWTGARDARQNPATARIAGEQVKANMGALGGRFWFLPYVDSLTGETPAMRIAYRTMLREPAIKAALYGQILNVASLELQVHPGTDTARGLLKADFVKHLCNNCYGGVRGIVESILVGMLIDGYCIANKVSAIEDRGRFAGKVILRALKAKNPDHLRLEVDQYNNITGLIGMQYNAGERFDPSGFVIQQFLPLYSNPTGMSHLRAAYRAYHLLDTVWKLRAIYLEKWSAGPFLKATYQLPEQKDQLAPELTKAKSGTWIAIPEGVQLEALNLATSGEGAFSEAIKDLWHDVYRGIAGAVLQAVEGTTSNARGNAEISRDVAELFVRHLVALSCDAVNRQIIPDYMDLNFADSEEHPTITLASLDDADLAPTLAVFKGAHDLGLPLSKKEVYKRLRLTEPTDKDDAIGPQDQGGGEGGGAPGQQPPPGGPPAATPPDRPFGEFDSPEAMMTDLQRLTAKADPTGTAAFAPGDSARFLSGDWVDCSSSAVSKARWTGKDGGAGDLEVVFTSGPTAYTYPSVPDAIGRDFVKAHSKGRWMNSVGKQYSTAVAPFAEDSCSALVRFAEHDDAATVRVVEMAELLGPVAPVSVQRFASDWTAEKGPRGGTRWKNSKTGKVVYKDPSGSKEEKKEDKKEPVKEPVKEAAKPALAAKPAKVDAKGQAKTQAHATVDGMLTDPKSITPDAVAGLRTHLDSMSVADLKALRDKVGGKGGTSKTELQGRIAAQLTIAGNKAKVTPVPIAPPVPVASPEPPSSTVSYATDRPPLALGGKYSPEAKVTGRKLEKVLLNHGTTAPASVIAEAVGGQAKVDKMVASGLLKADGGNLTMTDKMVNQVNDIVDAQPQRQLKPPQSMGEIRSIASDYSSASPEDQAKMREYLDISEHDASHPDRLHTAITDKLDKHLNPGSARERIKNHTGLQAKVKAVQEAVIDAATKNKLADAAKQSSASAVAAYTEVRSKYDAMAASNPRAARTFKKKTLEPAEKAYEEATDAYIAAKTEAEAATSEARTKVKKMLTVPDASAIGHTGDVPAGEATKQNVAAAESFLHGLVAKGPGGEGLPPVAIHLAAGGREHYTGSREHSVGVTENTPAKVHAHEMGHAIEERMPGANQAVRAFLAERVGKEQAVSLSSKYPEAGYSSDEVGRKDNFEAGMGSERYAYYAGKIYDHGSTEILSLGIERLYEDPAGFAHADPEHFALVVGILDGSLRHKPIPP